MRMVYNNISYKMDEVRMIRRIRRENRDTHNRYTYTPSKRMFNVVTGIICIGVGVWTWYIPFTTLPLISLGLFLIACPFSMWELIKGLGSDIKYYVGVRI